MSTKILVIDDSHDDRIILKRFINRPDKSITLLEASNAQEALDLIKDTDNIDCVFLDYMLPDMDGISLLKEIYDKSSDLGPFPVVMMTGQGSEAVAIDAIRYGAQDYLMKENISIDTLYIAMAKAREVYDLKQAHNEAKQFLEHSQKMEAVGKLTGGIAHDFNNLLTITFGNTRLLELLINADTIDKEMILDKVNVIQKATQRGADLVKKLMVFSRQRELEPAILNPNDLIEDLKDFLEGTLGEQIGIETDFSSAVHEICVDPGQLEHAIINIGVNARDAMLDGGTFTLKTDTVDIDRKRAQRLDIKAGPYTHLSLIDTGNGIKPDVLEKIFTPFFTTKDFGQGTGLGLSMVYGFVKESGGAVDVESTVGVGTTFHLYFPKAQNAANIVANEYAPQDAAFLKGQETILVVEDEEEIRSLTTDMLSEFGYNVLEAANGSDALAVLQAHNGNVHLVFTDIAMPGYMNGVQMAARAQVIDPEIKLLFTSGYASESLPDMHLASEYPVIHKPYHPEELMKKLRDVLEE